MTLFNSLLTAAVLALSALTTQTTATPLSNGLVARHAHVGTSPNQHGQLMRKRNSHRYRKRCLAQNAPGASSSSAAPAATANANSNNNNNNNNNGGNTYTPPPTGGSGCGNGKVGIAAEWNVDPGPLASPHACFTYNWDASDNDPHKYGGLTYVPMVSKPGNLPNWYANVVNRPDRFYPWVAGPNECNEPYQANMGTYEAADFWRQHVLPLRARGSKLLSPSVTSSPEGIRWIKEWYGLLGPNEKPDAIALHWYGVDFDSFKNFVNEMSGAFDGRHIWITEFACTLFPQQECHMDQFAFAAQAISFLNNHWAVDVYFPFGFVNDLGGASESVRLVYPGTSQTTPLGATFLYS